MDNIFEFMGLPTSEGESNPTKDFLIKVANKQLLSLANKRQTGVHAGQTIYAHLLNVVLVVDLAAQIVGCSSYERRILICAAVLHDLNKLDPENRRISEVANSEDIRKFLILYGLDQLLSDMDNSIEVIRRLVAAHSGHLHQGADSLLPLGGEISRDRLRNVLIPLLQLSDQAEVARKFTDTRKQEQVLSRFNAASDTQYKLQWHRLSEYRGPFSNLIHNAVIEEMEKNFSAKAFLNYAEGTFYLVPANQEKQTDQDIYNNVANLLTKKLKKLKGGNASDFVVNSNQGIKINAEIFATDLTIEDAFTTASRMVLNKVYKVDTIKDMETKAIQKAKEGYVALLDKDGKLFPRDSETMHMGEILRTLYKFLQAHCSELFKGKNKKFDDAWQLIYHALEVNVMQAFTTLDPLYHFPYVIARLIKIEKQWEYGTLLEKIIKIAQTFTETLSLSKNSETANPEFTEYLKNTLTFSCIKTKKPAFLKHLTVYTQLQEFPVCSLCSQTLPAQAMMAGDVAGLTVSQFSNRNLAGTNDPKRNSCAICREQLLVEKIGFAPSQSKGFYLHIFPETFSPPLFIEAMRDTFNQLKKIDARALIFDTRAIARNYENDLLELTFKPKASGLIIPLYSELIGNVITMPIYALGDNDTEKYLFALHYCLLIHRRFGQRVVLTQSIVPPVQADEMMESDEDNGIKLYLDGVPSALLGLVKNNSLNGQQSDQLFDLLHNLKVIADQIGTGEDLIDLARSLNHGELGIYFAAHRAIERNSKDSHIANARGGDIAERLKQIARNIINNGDKAVTNTCLTDTLEKMADIAWKKSIRGESLAHTALIKPMSIVFQLLRRQSNKELSFVKLVATEEILRHIERTSDYRVNAEKSDAIENWTALFFDELLSKGFGADVRRLIQEEKYVKAAYTTLIRQQLRKASDAKKQASNKN